MAVDDVALEEAISGSVAPLVFDESGRQGISDLLAGVTDTDFKKSQLEKVLGEDVVTEDWRVGEAMAESYLIENSDCEFPWPDGRDERKNGCSLPGADLVGFQGVSEEVRFAFGEVKTSQAKSYPPGVVYGRHGLKKQLEDLKGNRSIRDSLVKYLGHRATGAVWQSRFQEAAGAYFSDPEKVSLFGVLIRDVPPDKADLQARVDSLCEGCSEAMRIELLAIYLPEGVISKLAVQASEAWRKGGLS